jgi:hypothetical protein
VGPRAVLDAVVNDDDDDDNNNDNNCTFKKYELQIETTE